MVRHAWYTDKKHITTHKFSRGEQRVGCGAQQKDLTRANLCKTEGDHQQTEARRTYADIVRGMFH